MLHKDKDYRRRRRAYYIRKRAGIDSLCLGTRLTGGKYDKGKPKCQDCNGHFEGYTMPEIKRSLSMLEGLKDIGAGAEASAVLTGLKKTANNSLHSRGSSAYTGARSKQPFDYADWQYKALYTSFWSRLRTLDKAFFASIEYDSCVPGDKALWDTLMELRHALINCLPARGSMEAVDQDLLDNLYKSFDDAETYAERYYAERKYIA